MKTYILLIFSLIFCFLIAPETFAQEATDDWGDLTDSYNNAKFEKIITGLDYKKAIETKESFIKKSKKNNKKSKKTTEVQPEEQQIFAVPDSALPLLTLPVDVFYENHIIRQGFYLVNLKRDGEKYFLELRQGNNLPVAVIEAKGYAAQGKNILKSQISVENVDDKMIKINYNGDNLILESVLWKY